MPFLAKKPHKKVTRLFYATDLHGSERTYKKFLNAGKFYEANVLVMGGDITGKLLIPIIKDKNGNYRATLQGTVEHYQTEKDLSGLLERLGTLGFYHKIMNQDEFEALQGMPEEINQLFHSLAQERLQAWVDLAETRLANTGIKCFITGGNDDDPSVLEVIRHKEQRSFFDCENQIAQVDEEHSMISLGFSTPTPWKTPREVTDETLWDMIEDLVKGISDLNHCIFNFHDPPKDSTLDTCPLLDWSSDPPTPIIKAGQMVMHGAGSNSVRKAIETYQPMLGLHGHIHESQSVAKLGRTTCINPGSEYGEGVLRGCLIIITDGIVKEYQMTRG
jgi:Icc-related predicted phosphoesterase